MSDLTEPRIPAITAPPPMARLPLLQLILVGLQHVLLMYGGAVAVPLIIGQAAGLSREEIAFLIEADLLPTYLNQALVGPNIRQGIERNAVGQRVAYWFYRQHPGDLSGAALLTDLSRVPASEVLHHYQPQRPGQLRGEPGALSTLLRARNLDQFESAELTRKKIKARFAGVIYKVSIRTRQ